MRTWMRRSVRSCSFPGRPMNAKSWPTAILFAGACAGPVAAQPASHCERLQAFERSSTHLALEDGILLSSGAGLAVYDAGDPDQLLPLAYDAGDCDAAARRDSTIVCATGGGLRFLQWSGDSLRLVDQQGGVGNGIHALAFDGDLLFTANEAFGGLNVYSTAGEFSWAGNWLIGDGGFGGLEIDRSASLVFGTVFLQAYGLSYADPTSPQEIVGFLPVGEQGPQSDFKDTGLFGELLVLSGPRGADNCELLFYSLADLEEPLRLSTLLLPGRGQRLAFGDSLLYVASGLAGLRVVDFRDPTSPEEVGWYDTPGNAVHVAAQGSVAYVADSDGGLLVVRYDPLLTGLTDPPSTPGGLTLRPACPNPFNPATELAFLLPIAGAARLSVHDLLGREVARLIDGDLPAGEHDARFDASRLPSAVYVARLEAGGDTRTRKLLLLK